uniref:Transmembrane protein n=1 Tax=Anguilla anguilla TaxID=7936 RepID=A0A0E9V2M5_ANGAN
MRPSTCLFPVLAGMVLVRDFGSALCLSSCLFSHVCCFIWFPKGLYLILGAACFVVVIFYCFFTSAFVVDYLLEWDSF